MTEKEEKLLHLLCEVLYKDREDVKLRYPEIGTSNILEIFKNNLHLLTNHLRIFTHIKEGEPNAIEIRNLLKVAVSDDMIPSVEEIETYLKEKND